MALRHKSDEEKQDYAYQPARLQISPIVEVFASRTAD
jgi:hypothetical protein